MKLTVLMDNSAVIDKYLAAEPALSFYIEESGLKILFDAGYSGLFIDNARSLGINLLDLDYIVLSHGHCDHTWGLEPLLRFYNVAGAKKRPKIIGHPAVFRPRLDGGGVHTGFHLNPEALKSRFDIELSASPVKLAGQLHFLGEIPRTNDFEAKKPCGAIVMPGGAQDDYLLDDSALVYKYGKWLVVITGCAHSGIANICDYAKTVCQEKAVADIIGGLHLLNPSDHELTSTADYLRDLNPLAVHACHCTDLKSKLALAHSVNLQELGVGQTLEY